MRKIFITTAIFLCISAGGKAASFSDFSETHQAVDYLLDQKVIQGFPDGTFRPDSPINRAEFLKIVMSAAGKNTGGQNCFPDVKEDWFAPYVCAAHKQKFISGYPDGSFHPEQEINFAEASKIISKIFELPITPDNQNWYKQYVFALEHKKAIPLSTLNFSAPVSRLNMVEMIWRIKVPNHGKISSTYKFIELGNKEMNLEKSQSEEVFYQLLASEIAPQITFENQEPQEGIPLQLQKEVFAYTQFIHELIFNNDLAGPLIWPYKDEYLIFYNPSNRLSYILPKDINKNSIQFVSHKDYGMNYLEEAPLYLLRDPKKVYLLINDSKKIIFQQTDFDPESILKLNALLYADKNGIYQFAPDGTYETTETTIDFDQLTYHADGGATCGEGTYYSEGNKIYTTKLELVEEADAESFKILDSCNQIYIDHDNVFHFYYLEDDYTTTLFRTYPNADPETFTILDSFGELEFRQDENYIYLPTTDPTKDLILNKKDYQTYFVSTYDDPQIANYYPSNLILEKKSRDLYYIDQRYNKKLLANHIKEDPKFKTTNKELQASFDGKTYSLQLDNWLWQLQN